MISFFCNCGKQLRAQDEFAGQMTACPACGTELQIPKVEAIQPGAPPMVLPVQRPPEAGPPRRRRPRLDDEERTEGDAPALTSGKAATGFVLGLLSFFVPVLLGLPAIVLGALGLGDIGRSPGRLSGRGLAITAIVLGIVSSVVSPVVMIALLIPAVQSVREAAARVESQNNLKQINLALIQYADVNRGQLPPATIYSQDGHPLYSWRVLILPYLEEQALYTQFHLDEAWDSAHNLQFVSKMPKVYAHPLATTGVNQGLTHYQVFVGSVEDPVNRPIFANDPRQLVPFALPGPHLPVFQTQSSACRYPAQITDGTSNTILVAEAAEAVPWTKPGDLLYAARQPLPKLGGLFRRGYNVGVADGSVRFIDANAITEQTLRAAITANGGEVLGADW
jgi:hypothetical protein